MQNITNIFIFQSAPDADGLLPAENVAKRIIDLKVGEGGYAVPWAMDTDEKRRCWLNPEYVVHGAPGGTVSMWIERCKDGLHVRVPHGEQFRPERNIPGDYLPVVKVRGA